MSTSGSNAAARRRPATVLIGLGWDEGAEAIQEGKRAVAQRAGAPAEFASVTDDEPESDAMLVHISDPATEQRFGEALKSGTRVAEPRRA